MFGLRKTGAPPIDAPECCDWSGALRLKTRIEQYWEARGKRVTVKIVETRRGRHVFYDVRSDMKGALPRESET